MGPPKARAARYGDSVSKNVLPTATPTRASMARIMSRSVEGPVGSPGGPSYEVCADEPEKVPERSTKGASLPWSTRR